MESWKKGYNVHREKTILKYLVEKNVGEKGKVIFVRKETHCVRGLFDAIPYITYYIVYLSDSQTFSFMEPLSCYKNCKTTQKPGISLSNEKNI